MMALRRRDLQPQSTLVLDGKPNGIAGYECTYINQRVEKSSANITLHSKGLGVPATTSCIFILAGLVHEKLNYSYPIGSMVLVY